MASCDTCAYNVYDVGQHADDADRASAAGQLAEQGQFGIGARIAGIHDEDDAVRMRQGHYKECPYYRNGDEYAVVRHQM